MSNTLAQTTDIFKKNHLIHLELIKMKFKAYLQTERVDALARKLVAQR